MWDTGKMLESSSDAVRTDSGAADSTSWGGERVQSVGDREAGAGRTELAGWERSVKKGVSVGIQNKAPGSPEP